MTNDLSEIVAADAVEARLTTANKKGLFQQVAALAARRTGLPAKTIAAALTEREKLGSTGFGGGTAIPHGKMEGLEKVTGFFVRLAAPIDYQAVDGIGVDLVLVLLSPPDAGADHLKALASVSRMFRDRQIVAKLRGARSKDAIFALLSGVETRDAA
jgi:PTS system nitrogen regulatory IIA component